MTARTLILLRHAKAERPAGPADVDRSLTKRGHSDATAAGAWLASRSHRPDLVICSPAKRTRQTWHSVAVGLGPSAGGSSPVVRYEQRVYDGNAADLLELVVTAEESFTTVLLIGHNPSISVLSTLLDPAESTDSDGLRTAGIAVHEVAGAWGDVDRGQAPVTAAHTARS